MFRIVIVFPSGTDRRTRHEQNHLDHDDLDQSRSDDEERRPLEYFMKHCYNSLNPDRGSKGPVQRRRPSRKWAVAKISQTLKVDGPEFNGVVDYADQK